MATKTYGGGRYTSIDGPKLGGMGEVVICDDTHLNRKVAIKFLQDDIDKERLTDEIRALQAIRSKHVVRVYDLVVRQPGDQIGIVQEYLPGDDLRAFFRVRADDQRYLRTLYQLASGLADIHAHGVIHRDFKHNNVKHDDEGLLKIFDFGLSRHDTPDEAQTTGFRGTRGFSAPELYPSDTTFDERAGARRADDAFRAACHVDFTNAVDVYAFGATALHMATGALPDDLLQQPPQCDRWIEARGFSTVARNLPQDLIPLLNGSLKHDANARPTMQTIRRELERHLVKNLHRALVVFGSQNLVLDNSKRVVNLRRGDSGPGISIEYTGDDFKVRSFTGTVLVNNMPIYVGMALPGSCVISLDIPESGSREFVTLDVSRPEVVL